MERDHTRSQRHSALAASASFGPVTRFITLVAEAVWTVATEWAPGEQRIYINVEWEVNQANDLDLRQHCLGSRGRGLGKLCRIRDGGGRLQNQRRRNC